MKRGFIPKVCAYFCFVWGCHSLWMPCAMTTKDCSCAFLSEKKRWRRLQPLAHDDGLYTHLCENMVAMTAPFLYWQRTVYTHLSETIEATTAPSLWWRRNVHAHLSENIEATTAPSLWWRSNVHAHLSENMEATTAPSLWWRRNVHAHTCLKIWRRPQPLPCNGKGLYSHLSENMEAITVPMPCPMTTKDCARPLSNFRSHTRSNCCSTEHAEGLLVVQCMFLFTGFTQTVRLDTEYRIYSSHYGNVQCHLAHE